jgi:hypothetical protein
VEDELEVIREQMEDTRTSLSDKLEALEQQVLGTVEEATSAVAQTVETVQETVHQTTESVQETVAHVKESLDVRKHVRRHPWLMMGGAVASGWLVNWWLSPSSRRQELTMEPAPEEPPRFETSRFELEPVQGRENGHTETNGHAQPAAASHGWLPGPLKEAVEALRGLAIGSVMNGLRRLVIEAAPQAVTEELKPVLDHLTDNLGGKRLWEYEEECAVPGGQKEEARHEQSEAAEMGGSVEPARRHDEEPVGRVDPERAPASRGRNPASSRRSR